MKILLKCITKDTESSCFLKFVQKQSGTTLKTNKTYVEDSFMLIIKGFMFCGEHTPR